MDHLQIVTAASLVWNTRRQWCNHGEAADEILLLPNRGWRLQTSEFVSVIPD